jgi:hypothetical protein
MVGPPAMIAPYRTPVRITTLRERDYSPVRARMPRVAETSGYIEWAARSRDAQQRNRLR